MIFQNLVGTRLLLAVELSVVISLLSLGAGCQAKAGAGKTDEDALRAGLKKTADYNKMSPADQKKVEPFMHMGDKKTAPTAEEQGAFSGGVKSGAK